MNTIGYSWILELKSYFFYKKKQKSHDLKERSDEKLKDISVS